MIGTYSGGRSASLMPNTIVKLQFLSVNTGIFIVVTYLLMDQKEKNTY